MLCSHCQKEIADGSLFCTECGARVAADILMPAQTAFSVPDPTLPVSASHSAETTSSVELPVQPVSAPAQPALQPVQSYSPAPAAFVPQTAPVFAGNGNAYSYAYDESTYYHIDAREEYDFEALRGISIVLVVISTLCLVGILMPLPIAIVALVKACGGIGERNPYEKTRKFNTCRLLIIISICVLCFYILLFIIGFCFASVLGTFTLPSIS